MKKFFRHLKMRKGQEDLLNDIYTTIKKGKIGLFEAPTGLGKTDASISASLKYAIENDKVVCFITSKTTQHKIALDVVKGINKKNNMNIKAVDFISKSNMCIDPFLSGGGSEFYEMCEKKISKRLCQPYLNTIGRFKEEKEIKKEKIINYFSSLPALTSMEMKKVCEKKELCPYETSMILGANANLFILDVNHIFIPELRERFLTRENLTLNDIIFIFDEAHNLPNRLRSLLGESISLPILRESMKEVNYFVENRDINDILVDFLNDFIAKIDNLSEGFVNQEYLETLFEDYDIDNILKELNKINYEWVNLKSKKSSCYSVKSFMESWIFNSNTKTRFYKNNKLYIKGLDPSLFASEIFYSSYSSILMSATLSPFEMFVDLLGIRKRDVNVMKKYKSAFDTNNRLILYDNVVTSKYKEREKHIDGISNKILQIINITKGNIAIFFPSYNFLNTILKNIKSKSNKKIFIQKQNTSSNLRERLIQKFKNEKQNNGGVLFAVAGGSFSEGVDFPGDDLKGLIIVGIPFPEPDFEIKALIEYYDEKYKTGVNYAYTFPTIMKVIQAIGRLIRTEEDSGFVVLLDKRYGWLNYKKLFPEDFNFMLFDIDKIKKFINR